MPFLIILHAGIQMAMIRKMNKLYIDSIRFIMINYSKSDWNTDN